MVAVLGDAPEGKGNFNALPSSPIVLFSVLQICLKMGTETLKEQEAVASMGEELLKSLFPGQGSMQPQGALEKKAGDTQDMGKEPAGLRDLCFY